ncbi:hypothetical protein [Nonlabens sp. Asnod3-H03]|uniref:hypothetical protein n=1 Tax=Nonlabens sp. Asnod3-H03 TaxID=3160580 RepID=UPI00386A9E79
MATVNYLVRGNSNPTNITLRFRHSNKFDIYCTTDYAINPRYWSNSKKQVTSKGDVDLNNLQSKLNELKNAIIKEFNNTEIHKINRNWIIDQIKIFKGEKTRGQKRSDLVIDYIQHVIDTAPIRKNQKGGVGLSERRVKGYNTLLTFIKNYQKDNNLRVKDIDQEFINEFLYSNTVSAQKTYAPSYIHKLAGDLVTVCKDAAMHNIEISNNLLGIKISKPKKGSIIFLNDDELEKIESLELKTEGLINARKWLLLGCHIGQRQSDLLVRTEKDIIYRNGIKLLEFRQQKTPVTITIPTVGKIEKLLKDGFPYQITNQIFNNHLKTIGEKAQLNELCYGGISTGKHQPLKYGAYPKYKLLASHVCRRSFASNYYGKMPLHLLMHITGHKSQKTFFNYIGTTASNYSQEIANHFISIEKKAIAKKENAPLKVIAS